MVEKKETRKDKPRIASEADRRRVQIEGTARNMHISEESLEVDQVKAVVEVVRDSAALRRELSEYRHHGLLPRSKQFRQYLSAVQLLEAKHHILLGGIKLHGSDGLQRHLAEKFSNAAEIHGCEISASNDVKPEAASAKLVWKAEPRIGGIKKHDFGNRPPLWWNEIHDVETRAHPIFQQKVKEKGKDLGISPDSVDVFDSIKRQLTHIIAAESLAEQSRRAMSLKDVPGLTPPASVRLGWGYNLDQLVVGILSDSVRLDGKGLNPSDFAIELGQVAKAHGLVVKLK